MINFMISQVVSYKGGDNSTQKLLIEDLTPCNVNITL
jgi:hypothetical protein